MLQELEAQFALGMKSHEGVIDEGNRSSSVEDMEHITETGEDGLGVLTLGVFCVYMIGESMSRYKRSVVPLFFFFPVGGETVKRWKNPSRVCPLALHQSPSKREKVDKHKCVAFEVSLGFVVIRPTGRWESYIRSRRRAITPIIIFLSRTNRRVQARIQRDLLVTIFPTTIYIFSQNEFLQEETPGLHLNVSVVSPSPLKPAILELANALPPSGERKRIMPQAILDACFFFITHFTIGAPRTSFLPDRFNLW